MITRKEFLSLSSLGIFSLFIPSSLFSKNNFSPSTDVNILLKSAADLRKQKKYNQAKQMYQQIINQFPGEIRAYDGMRKVLLSKKNKEWEVIQMFKIAQLSSPNSVEIKQRLYKEYMNAALGNKKVVSSINFNGRLLIDVKQKYESFVQNHPNNKNIQKQYSKICRLLDSNADTQNAKQNLLLKKYKKAEYKKSKHKFDGLSVAQLENRLNVLLAKPYSKDRKQHIRELYKLSFNKLRKEKQSVEALNKAVTYYNNIDKEDPLFLKYIRDLSRYHKKFDTLINVENQNHTLKNSFWSAVSLFDAHFLKAGKQGGSIPAISDTLLTFMENNIEDFNMEFEVNSRKIKLAIHKNSMTDAKTQILAQCKNMSGISNSHLIDKMNVIIAMFYKKSGDNESKNQIVTIATNPKVFLDSENDLVKSTAMLNLNRSYKNSIHIQNLNKQVSKI